MARGELEVGIEYIAKCLNGGVETKALVLEDTVWLGVGFNRTWV